MAQPTFEEVDNKIVDGKKVKTITKYWNCPVRFIPSSIMYFLDQYAFYQDFKGAFIPAYDEINPRFMEALKYYKSEISKAMRSHNG